VRIKAPRHGRHVRLGEGQIGWYRHAHLAGRILDQVLRRRGLVVCKIECSRQLPLRAQRSYTPDIVDMNAVEHLPGLDDAPRRSLTQLIETRPARSVDARKPQDQQWYSALGRKVAPLLLDFDAVRTAFVDRPCRRRLVDPLPAEIAIDADA